MALEFLSWVPAAAVPLVVVALAAVLLRRWIDGTAAFGVVALLAVVEIVALTALAPSSPAMVSAVAVGTGLSVGVLVALASAFLYVFIDAPSPKGGLLAAGIAAAAAPPVGLLVWFPLAGVRLDGGFTLFPPGGLTFEEGLVGVTALTVVLSLVVVHRIDRPGGRWGDRLRSRFAMGVPWGTLVVSAFVLAVYLFLQDGLNHWYDPVTIPFRAWSYLYPQGVLTAAFAHNGPGHLIGNLTGTLVFGTVAEYAWGHFPDGRGESSFGSLRTNPWVRALVVFPGAVVVVGLFTAAFSMGPVIGFSGVVFALAGVALTRYPIGTVVGAVGFTAVRTLYSALQSPVVTATPEASAPSAPWWAQIAIQGHAIGLLMGITIGWYVFVRRSERPSAVRIWAGVLLFGMEETLWAVYWFRGNEQYVLFRGPGIVLVSLLALLVTVSLTASDRSLVSGLLRERTPSDPDSNVVLGRLEADGGTDPREDGGSDSSADEDGDPEPILTTPGDGDDSDGEGDGPNYLTRQNVAIGLLFTGLWLLAVPGIGSNVFTAASHDAPDDGVTVRDYTVFYAEDVTNEMVSIVNVSAFNQTTQVRTSGVIVTSAQRGIWQQVVSKGQLAFQGSTTVDVGGIGWRERIRVTRRGWSAVGGGTAYEVFMDPPGPDPERLVFQSANATADPIVAGRNVSVAPSNRSFDIVVQQNGTVTGVGTIPSAGNFTSVNGLQFANRNGTLYAQYNETIVRVATQETYDD